MAILFELLFAGSVLAFCVWQIVSVRRSQREDAERRRREAPPED